jgi:hypothetical protein
MPKAYRVRLCVGAVLPPHMLAMLPQHLKDLLQWHIKTNNDHLVSISLQNSGTATISSDVNACSSEHQ